MTFSDELAAFRGRAPNHNFRALIMLGTRQPVTAALLIGALNPERVAFLLTDETQALPAQVEALLGYAATGWICPTGDHSSTLRVYEGLRELLTLWSDLERKQIAVDVTGGLKPMSLGLEKAAHALELTTIYIQSEYESLPDGRVRPISGTQQLVVPPDPYVIFGDLEAAEAQRLHAAHDYPGAERIFADLAQRVPDARGSSYAARARIAAAYAALDAFDLQAAAKQLAQLHNHPALPVMARARVGAHHAALATVRPLVEAARPEYGIRDYARAMGFFAAQQVALLDNSATAATLLAILYANALRRAEQDRLDTAALMLYRCLELMSQQRLATHGVYTEWPRDPMDRLLQQFPALRFKKRGDRWPKITLGDGYEILQIIGDAFGQRCDLDRIRDGADLRNQSLLAHGFSFISASEHDSFKRVVDEVRVHWCTVAGIDWPVSLQSATFLHSTDL